MPDFVIRLALLVRRSVNRVLKIPIVDAIAQKLHQLEYIVLTHDYPGKIVRMLVFLYFQIWEWNTGYKYFRDLSFLVP